jgi:DNA (cytosine-5)-methyltransferase 1
MQSLNSYSVVDLFCGVGGLTHGFILEGFNVIAGIDFDINCKYAYEKNNIGAKFIHKDIATTTSAEIESLYPPDNLKILVGCAPCQPFSRYTSGTKSKIEESKWGLLNNFAKIISDVKPEIVSMENVPQLATKDRYDVYSNFLRILEDNGYFISNPKQIVYCPDYGIPQSRRRLVLLASKLGEIELISPTHTKNNYQTVKQVIGDLPKLYAGEVDKQDKLHRTPRLSNLNKLRISLLKEGQDWKSLPQELIADCHKKESGKTFNGIYGRMKWNEPSPTMTTHCIGFGNGKFGHPEQDRAISLREAAILQTFPIDYDFFENEDSFRTTNIQRHIGNAVPVLLGLAIAKSIKLHIQNFLNK